MNRVLKNCPVCKTLDHPKAEAKGHLCSPCAVERSRTWYKENPELLRNMAAYLEGDSV